MHWYRYSVLLDTQSSGIKNGIGKEKMVSELGLHDIGKKLHCIKFYFCNIQT